MNEDEISNHIFITLAKLYEDPLHRSQYKRFTFDPPDRKPAQRILAKLVRNFIIEQLQPEVVRLTDYGYQWIHSGLNKISLNKPHQFPEEKPGGYCATKKFKEMPGIL